MSASSSWPFCPQCGTILDAPSTEFVVCSYCSFKCKFHDLSIPKVITTSAPTPKPSWIGDDETEEEKSRKHGNKNALIEEPCPKCGNPETYFYTLQLRSVDEGSTVFYECPKCTHKYSQNN